MSLKLTIGTNVRRVRGRKRISQKDLAQQIEVSAGYLAHIEKGNRNMTVDVVERICDALNIYPEALLYNYGANKTLTKQRGAVKNRRA
jgi:transcriptional regulator with XRE-family HTH domain